MRQLERQEEYEERFALVSERVDQLKEDAEVPDPFASYFKEVAAFLGLVKRHMSVWQRAPMRGFP